MADFLHVEPTVKLFLENSYLLECEDAKVVSFKFDEEKNQGELILDKTLFYPQGGGQPTDIGTITVLNAGDFTVTMVRMNENQQVVHYGSAGERTKAFLASSGSSAVLKVDSEKRMIYTRLHSAGHALDAAMRACGYPATRLKPTKGYHFLDGPFVEYEMAAGEPLLSPEEIAALPTQLTVEMHKLIEADIPTEVEDMPKELAIAALLEQDGGEGDAGLTHYPDTVRMVKICGLFIPCGGTHIKSTGEIGTDIKITKLKKKKQCVKVSYTL